MIVRATWLGMSCIIAAFLLPSVALANSSANPTSPRQWELQPELSYSSINYQGDSFNRRSTELITLGAIGQYYFQPSRPMFDGFAGGGLSYTMGTEKGIYATTKKYNADISALSLEARLGGVYQPTRLQRVKLYFNMATALFSEADATSPDGAHPASLKQKSLQLESSSLNLEYQYHKFAIGLGLGSISAKHLDKTEDFYQVKIGFPMALDI